MRLFTGVDAFERHILPQEVGGVGVGGGLKRGGTANLVRVATVAATGGGVLVIGPGRTTAEIRRIHAHAVRAHLPVFTDVSTPVAIKAVDENVVAEPIATCLVAFALIVCLAGFGGHRATAR